MVSRPSEPGDASVAEDGEESAFDEPDGQPDADQSVEETHREPLPWSIKLLGLAFAGYLLIRVIQLGGWVVRWFSGG